MLLKLNEGAFHLVSKLIFKRSILLDYPGLKSACNFEVSYSEKMINFNLTFDSELWQQAPLLLIRTLGLSSGFHIVSSLDDAFLAEGNSNCL